MILVRTRYPVMSKLDNKVGSMAFKKENLTFFLATRTTIINDRDITKNETEIADNRNILPSEESISR
jgi:hypothetical protein